MGLICTEGKCGKSDNFCETAIEMKAIAGGAYGLSVF